MQVTDNDTVSHLLRIALPDVPGSLGSVASTIGLAGANIMAVEVLEQPGDGTVIDDVFVEFSTGVLPDMVVSAVQRLDGVQVLWVSRYAPGGNLHRDLEAVEVITGDPMRALDNLTWVLPHTFRCDWALAFELRNGHAYRLASSSGAPELPSEAAAWFPVVRAGCPDVPETWPGLGSTLVALAPVGSPQRAVMFGRQGGPGILASELARLNHLAALTASIESTS